MCRGLGSNTLVAMTQLLHRLGRFAAVHPWKIVAGWLVVAAVVLAASTAFGADTEDSMEVPGLDSQLATDLLEDASSGQAGLTAQLVMTPDDPAEGFAPECARRPQVRRPQRSRTCSAPASR